MIGKLSPDRLDRIIERTGAEDGAVRLGPALGEDAAVIELPGTNLIVSTDPLSLAAEELGRLAVHVACNDVATAGARPRWVTSALFLPDDDPDVLETLIDQLDETARALDVAIVGGHTEYAPALERPLAVLTAFGTTDRPVSTGGADPGDVIVLAGTAGIEGTGILATDFREELIDRGVELADIERGAERTGSISVVEPAIAVRSLATGMHDPTEGGIVAGLVEIAAAADCRIEVDPDAIPVGTDTAALCAAMDVDPLRIFGSGALLVTVRPKDRAAAVDALAATGIEASVIGRVTEGDPIVTLGEERVAELPRDQLYPLWE